MAEKDYKALARSIAALVGGEDNIVNVSHCMTRLRLQLLDGSGVERDRAREIPGVLDLIIQNGEYQFVIGQDVASLYREFAGVGGGPAEGPAPERGKGGKVGGKAVEAVLSFLGGVFSPVIPVLVAGGLTGAVLTLLATLAGVSAGSGAYRVLDAISQAAFWFLPVLLGFSTASRLGANGYLGAFLGAILLFQGVNGVEGLDFFGLPIRAVGYHANIFPVILGAAFMSLVYRFLQRRLPVSLRTTFAPLLTMLVTVPVTLVVLGPVGSAAGAWLSSVVLALYRAAAPLAVMAVGALTCWMVYFGLNNATYPICFVLMTGIGSDPLFCTGMAPANVAVGGACLAVALIDRREGRAALDAGVTALRGVTEPGVYGVLFTRKYALIGAMVGGGVGGFAAGWLGMTQYVFAPPGFLSFAAYITPPAQGGGWTNLIVSLAVMALAVAVSFAVTYILGRRAARD